MILALGTRAPILTTFATIHSGKKQGLHVTSSGKHVTTVLALELEGTLISNALSQIPRAGLLNFWSAAESCSPAS